jgi:hypothetical protein
VTNPKWDGLIVLKRILYSFKVINDFIKKWDLITEDFSILIMLHGSQIFVDIFQELFLSFVQYA